MANLEHLNLKQSKTLMAIDKALEDKNKLQRRRTYLGASQIGEPCWRKLFYSFRSVRKRSIKASGIRAIEDGFMQETVMAERLRMIQHITLYTEDDNGEQIGFEMMGFLKGHVDGMILNPLDGSLTEYEIWEHKSVNQTKFNKLKKIIEEKGEKKALSEWDEIYYSQGVLYMKAFDKKRHTLTVSTPGGRDYVLVRTEANNKFAENLIEKAKIIIFDNFNIPAKLSNNREFFQCKWCEFSGICHDGEIPDINCCTCRYRSPDMQSKKFKCLFTNTIIDEKMLHADNCQNHVYNPALIPAKLIEQQADSCIFETEDGFKFANTALVGFPEVKDDLQAIYTSKELFEVVKNVNNLSAESVKISDTFKAENMDTAQNSPEKQWKKQIDPRLKGI